MRQSASPHLRNRTPAGATAELEAEIRRAVVDSVHDIPPSHAAYSGWTARHLEVVRSHGLGPWLHQWLARHPDVGAPPEIVAALREDYRSSALQSLVREASLFTLLGEFETVELPVILLKGSYLARHVYRDPALRPMDDVDILIHEEDLEQARSVLSNIGYRSAVKSLSPYHKVFKPALPFFRSSPTPGHVDLHWALQSMDYYRFPSEALWEHAVEVRLGGHRALFLSPEANYIHIGLHTLNHADAMRNWLDLALAAKEPGVDWDRIVSMAARLGALRAMHWVFQELARNWSIEPPPHIVKQVEAYRPRWIEDRVICYRARRYWRFYARLERLPGWGSKLGYVSWLALGRIVRR